MATYSTGKSVQWLLSSHLYHVVRYILHWWTKVDFKDPSFGGTSRYNLEKYQRITYFCCTNQALIFDYCLAHGTVQIKILHNLSGYIHWAFHEIVLLWNLLLQCRPIWSPERQKDNHGTCSSVYNHLEVLKIDEESISLVICSLHGFCYIQVLAVASIAMLG